MNEEKQISTWIKDFLTGKKRKVDKSFKTIEKLEQTSALVISNPNSDIKVAANSNIEVPKFVAPFVGNTGLRKMQNMLATSTVTYIDNIPELTALEKSDERISAYNPDDEMKRRAIERLREFEFRSYADHDIDKLINEDEEIESLKEDKKITIRI